MATQAINTGLATNKLTMALAAQTNKVATKNVKIAETTKKNTTKIKNDAAVTVEISKEAKELLAVNKNIKETGIDTGATKNGVDNPLVNQPDAKTNENDNKDSRINDNKAKTGDTKPDTKTDENIMNDNTIATSKIVVKPTVIKVQSLLQKLQTRRTYSY
jgi:hypothetical protein